MYSNIAEKNLVYILLIGLFIIGLYNLDGYGISWDEPIQRITGKLNYDYIFYDDPALLDWKDRDYGVAFELPLIAVERIINLTDTRDIYLSRHLITHIFFLIGALFAFKIIDFLYQNKLLATIGFLLIVLQPRLYAHSFFNTKDIPFMSMFVICLYLSAIALDKRTIMSFILLGIGVGILINLRIMGVLLPFCVGVFLIIDMIKDKKYWQHIKLGLLFTVAFVFILYVCWPLLWKDPIQNFILAFKNMSRFRWGGTVLFNGDLISAKELGWNYIPVWFSVTTPIIYLITGLFGVILLMVRFFKNPLKYLFDNKERLNLLFLICCFAPVIVVILLQSRLYDGWRQLYFIYPSFVLLIIYGLDFLIKKNMKKLVAVSYFLTFGYIAVDMIRSYPLQNVYFNQFVSLAPPEHIRQTFEMDYWGVSYKQSLEYILRNDHCRLINIAVANYPGNANINILPAADRERINYVPVEEATYFITNYRWHPHDYEEFERFRYHSIKIRNNTVSEIFKLK